MSEHEYDHLVSWDMMPPPYDPYPLPPEEWRHAVITGIVGAFMFAFTIIGVVVAMIGIAWLLGVVAPPARAVPLNGLATGSSVADTDTIPICQKTTGCGTTDPLHQVTIATVNGHLLAPAISNAYFVATAAGGGNDSNAGTYAAPFLTVAHAISVASSTSKKTIYVRAGTYNTAASGSNCFGNPYAIGIIAGDEGITISYWPPDGIDSAVFDFTGVSMGFCIFNGGSGSSIVGLKIQNPINSGIRLAGGALAGQGATGVSLTDNVVTGVVGTGGFGAAIELIGNVQGVKLLRNDIETAGQRGISWIDNGVGLGGTGMDIEYNFIRNTCTLSSDCGQIYVQNVQCGATGSCSTGGIIEHNYVTAAAGSYAIYLDDWASNFTVEFNTMFSGTVSCGFIHAGKNDVWKYNICDLGGAGGALTTHGPLQQQSDTTGTPVMTGNVWQDNIIVCNSTSSPCGAGYATFAPTPPNPANVANNLYWNFNNQTGGVSGVANTSGTGANNDSNPTGANPQLHCYIGAIDQSGTAFASPTLFLGSGNYAVGPQSPAIGTTNIPFLLPQTGTAPSWGSSC